MQRNTAKRNETTRQNNATKHDATTLSTDNVLAKFIYKGLPIIDGQPMIRSGIGKKSTATTHLSTSTAPNKEPPLHKVTSLNRFYT
eukprot:6369503-Ditylum_brightwellii.AAC.1